MTIYIGNLSFQAEQEDLLDLFSQYGEVKSASLPLDRETGRKRGFGFVEMNSDDDEQKAIDDLQNVEWMGRMIRVNKATLVSAPVAVVAAVVTAVAAVAVVTAATAVAAAMAVAVATAGDLITKGSRLRELAPPSSIRSSRSSRQRAR